MDKKSEEKYCIAGAGLVGSLLAVMLAKRGKTVDVLERRPDMRQEVISAGRSINLALSTRGLEALEAIGLADEIRNLCIPMQGRMVHAESGETRFMQYGKEGQAINSISRGELNKMLLNKAEESDGIRLYFNEKLDHIDYPSGMVYATNTISGSTSKRQYRSVFGTDGAFSVARLSLMKTDRLNFEYTQEYLEHGYKELSIPAGENGKHLLEKNALHIWPRKSFMMIALPNLDGSFTCTLFLSLKGEISFEQLQSEKQVSDFFHRYFPDATGLMTTLHHDFFTNPTSSLVTIRCNPWHFDGKGLLLGDAAHAIVPFYGQGMNAGFEDCSVLSRLMNEHGDNWETIFPEFNRLRKPNGDAVGDLALRNFIEMRDLVANPKFILKNTIDKKLGVLFPDKWVPIYSMVTFSHMPYAEAKRLGEKQDIILEQIIKNEPGIGAKIDLPEFAETVEKYLS